MAVTSQDWLTGFQPIVNPPQVDYMSRYHAGLGYGPGVFASIQRADAALQAHRDEQEAAERQARYREQAFGEEPDELPAYLAGPSGLQSDRRKLQSFAAAGDLAGMRDVLARMRKMRERHADALVAWQGVADDGAFGKTMADAATALSTESFLDDPVLGQPAGGLTVRAVLDNSTPEARARAASRAATAYGVSAEAGDILTNQENPLYHVLDGLRARQAEGALLAKSARTSEEGDAIGRQSESALSLYSEFLAGQARSGDWDQADLGAFVKAAGSVYSGAMSSGQLESLAELYRHDKGREGRLLSADAWMRRRKAAVDAMVPQITEVSPTGDLDAQGQPRLTVSRRPDARVDTSKLLDLVLQAHDIASKYELPYSTDTLESAVGEQFRRQYEVEEALGKKLADLGVDKGAAAYAAISELAGTSYLPGNDDAGKHLVLKNASDTLNKVRHVLGYNADGTSTDYQGFHSLADDIVSGVVEASLRAEGSGQALDLLTPVSTALNRHAEHGGWTPTQEFVDKVARRIVGNMRSAKVESISQVLLDERGYFAHKNDGSVQVDADGRPVIQSPDSKVDLTTGDATQKMPSGKPGLLTTRDIASLNGQEASLRSVYSAVAGISDETFKPALESVLALQQRKRMGAAHPLGKTGKVQETVGKVMAQNAVKTLGESALPSKTTEFVRTGDLLRFVTGADKATRVTEGDRGLRSRAWGVVDELVSRVLDQSDQVSSAELDLLARLIPEVMNRGEQRITHRDEYDRLDRFATKLDLDIAYLVLSPVPEDPLDLSGRIEGYERHVILHDISDAKADELYSKLKQRLTALTNKPVDGTSFTKATGMALPESVGHGSKNMPDDLEYGGPLALYQKLNWVEAPGSSTTPTDASDATAQTPPSTDKENADAFLSSILSKDAQLNMLRDRLAPAVRRVVGDFGDKNSAQGMLDDALRDLDRIYETDGLSSALDYAASYERSRLYFVEKNVPIVGSTGHTAGTRLAVLPQIVRTPEQLRSLKDQLGVDDAALGALSFQNRRRYAAELEAQSRETLLRIQAALAPQEQ